MGALAVIVIFLSNASWMWDEFVQPLRQSGLERPRVIEVLHHVPWHGWVILGLFFLLWSFVEHAYPLISKAESKLEDVEKQIYDGRPIFVLDVSTRLTQKGKIWSLDLRNIGARPARYVVMEPQSSQQGRYHLRFGQILALSPNAEEPMPYAVTDDKFCDLTDGSAILKFLYDNEVHDDPLLNAALTWWDIDIKFRDTDESVKDGGKVRLCFEVKNEVLYGTAVPCTERNFKPPS
ncbi:MAG: hypothetical protein WCC32_13695 [Terriglobales bacterium]